MRTTSGRYDWSAGAVEDLKGYVCVTRCKKGFEWFADIKQCLRVVEEMRFVLH